VSDQSPLTNAASVAETRVIRMKAQAGNRFFTRSNFKPKALALAGLAVAIALWALGYRLSTYQLHPGSTGQTAAAKLCVEPRNASFAAVSPLKAGAHRVTGLPAILTSVRPIAAIASGFICVPLERVHRPATFDFLIPFRSPPQLFSLA
jgi:hypothetical protein